MIAQELEVSLHDAFVAARQKRHQFITVEHLLLAILRDGSAAIGVVSSCGIDGDHLRKELARFVDEHASISSNADHRDSEPTVGFQRVIQRAILNVQSVGGREVTSADVLLAIFSEKDAPAVSLLNRIGLTPHDVANRMERGSGKTPGAESAATSAAQKAESTGGLIAQELEVSLHMAFVAAREKRHEFITVEHLLLALLDNPAAAEVLRACGASMDELRKDLTRHVEDHTPRTAADREVDTQPTLGFQRAIQRAISHVQSVGKKEVTGANVLVAIFGEKDSHAVYFLQQHGVVRLDVVNYISHGVATTQKPSEEKIGDAQTEDASDVQVILYNDEHTPMEFVVRVLQDFFSMDREEATEVMLEVHRDGKAVCGLYSRQVGEELVKQVLAYAHLHGHPLRCATVVPK